MSEYAIPIRTGGLVEPVEVVVVDELVVVGKPLFAFRQPLGLLLGEKLLARHVLGIAAEQNVRATAGHVGGDRNGALSSSLRHELGFLRVVLRVQHDVLDAPALELRRQLLGLLDGDRADQDRTPGLLLGQNVVDDRLVLFRPRPVDRVGLFNASQRPVGRNDDDVELVDLGELFRLGFGGPGHARQLLVFAEVVLEGDGRERLVLALDLDLFLGLDRLVETIAPAAARHQTAGELVDDHDLTVLDHVVDVDPEDRVRAQGLLDMVLDVRVFHVVEVPAVQTVREVLLGRLHAALGQRDRLVLLVDDVIARQVERFSFFGLDVAFGFRAGLQAGDDAIDFVIQLGRGLGRTGDDERRARLVDEDAVDLVDDGEVVAALNVLRQLELHVVAEIVEAELVVGAVGDVGRVRLLPLGIVQLVLDDAHRHAEEAVNLAHPFRVAAGQVVVRRDDVDAFAFQGVQVGRQRRHQRLALAGLHLGDGAAVKNRPADDLDVEMPHVQHPAAGLADDGECLGHEIVQRLALGQALAEFRLFWLEAARRSAL